MTGHLITWRRQIVVACLAIGFVAGAAEAATAFIHNSQHNSFTIRHGMYRGGSLSDRAIQVSDNVVTGGYSSSVRLRIAVYRDDLRVYDYTCTNSDNCYHNHNGSVSECHYRGANAWSDAGLSMDYHLNQDSDYCGT